MRREARIRRIALKLAAKGANYGQGLASCSPLLVGTHCFARDCYRPLARESRDGISFDRMLEILLYNIW